MTLFCINKALGSLHKIIVLNQGHLDYFYDVFNTFLGPKSGRCCQWRERKLSDFIKNIWIFRV